MTSAFAQGKLWESRSRDNYRYMMVFEHNAIDGTDKLVDALRKLEKLERDSTGSRARNAIMK